MLRHRAGFALWFSLALACLTWSGNARALPQFDVSAFVERAVEASEHRRAEQHRLAVRTDTAAPCSAPTRHPAPPPTLAGARPRRLFLDHRALLN